MSSSGRQVPPPGGTVHPVSQGENLESIAFRYGHFSPYLWEHADNAALRGERGDPNVLLPGDSVAVPALRERSEPAATGRVHRFRRRGVPSLLRFRALVGDRPLAGQPYVVEADGAEHRGTTDADGTLECHVRPDLPDAVVHVGRPPFVHTYRLSLRTLDPVAEASGVRGRLANLGYLEPGAGDAAVVESLRVFQRGQGLAATGEADEATRERLLAVHGS
jgi:hypothetical protein